MGPNLFDSGRQEGSITISCVPLNFSNEPLLPKSVFDELHELKGSSKSKKVVNIKNYIINENATIIFWDDGTKTVVKKSKEDKFDKRLGLLIGYFQKNCGMSKTKANKFLDNLVVENKKEK